MNAGVLWVALPLAVALGLGLWPQAPTRRKRWVAMAVAGGLALVAAWVPLGQPLPLLGYRWTWTLEPQWRVLGRMFVLDEASRGWLLALYTWAALWAWFSAEARLAPDFPAWSLALPAALTAALAAVDFLITVLLFGLVLLALVFVWVPSHRRLQGHGMQRFLTFAVLGLPLLLLGLARLPGLETAPPQTPAVKQVGLLLGLGLALWAGAFPFHTAYPLLGQEGHPARLGFGFWFVHVGLVAAVLRWAPDVLWLRDNPALLTGLQTLGLATIALAGLLLLAQRDLGRVTGYVALLNTGWSWLVLAQGLPQASVLFLALAWPRALLWLGWTWALAVLGLPHDDFSRRALAGRGRRAPLVAILAVLGLGAWAPWPGLGLAGLLSTQALPPDLAPWGWLALTLTFVSLTWAAVRWAEVLFLGAPETEPNLPETWRDRAWAAAWLLVWLAMAWWPGGWYTWAAAALKVFP